MIFFAKEWVDKVIVISRAIDRMIVIKVLVQRIIISLTSDLTAYAPQCGLDDSQKDFHDSLINAVWKLVETKISIIAGEFIGHVENDPEYYEGQHEG